MRKIMAVAAMLAGAVVACSSSSSSGGGSGSGTVNGTIGGKTLAAKDAISNVQTQTPDGSTASVTAASIIITDISGSCSVAQRSVTPPNLSYLVLVIGQSGSQLATGTYNVGIDPVGGKFVTASFQAQDAQCKTTVDESATSGTITITSVNGSSISGSFDVTLAAQGSMATDHVTGTFAAQGCTLPMTDGGTMMPTCGS